ncbi:hypothetical protein PZB74_04660 [Porifericola rhodea]|uniref:hypothetical protein n=1 Tax=Porifericola rhodea TaxID=930972 RepID=UPI002666EBC8|nr:hypothetical protein [Porifericola rhodea]WKN32634.1 hypothetical protein PZB74_04660 [Porifericola rhodea]
MRLLDAILLSLSVAFFIIGVHQTMVGSQSVSEGVANAYVFFMVSLILLFWHRVRRKSRTQDQVDKKNKDKNQKKRKPK